MIKYAIYKNDIGLRAVKYADTEEAIKCLPYIHADSLPVIINRVGGYTSFIEEYEKQKGFIKIIEIEDDTEPLTREQMYPKNVKGFQYGWISPDGDTFHTGYEGHMYGAEAICKELGYDDYNEEMELENRGWVKVTANGRRGALETDVYSKELFITKKQADTLFDLGLWDVSHVPSMVHISEGKW